MPKDVIITPASGKLDFHATTGGSVLANINLTDNNDLSLSTTSGNLIIGDASRDVYIGDGTNEVDIVFEQNGEIRSVAGKYVTINAGVVKATGIAVNTSSPNALVHVYGSTPNGTILNVEGTNGPLFSVVDNLDGTLMSVNNSASLPVLEVFSDDSVVAGRFGQNDFVVSSGGNVGIGVGSPSHKLDVKGTLKLRSDLNSVNISVDDVYGLNIDGNVDINFGSFKISDPDLVDRFFVNSDGSITSGSWNASTIAVNKGGTGATTLTTNEVLIGNDTSAVSTLSRSGIDSRETFPPAAHNQAESTITFTDNTTGNASTSVHGYLPKLGAGTTNYLRADGSWATPPDTNTTYSGSTSIILTDGSFQRAALTGDVTAEQNNNGTTIANDAVTNAKTANMAVNTIKGRITAGTGDPEDLNAESVRSIINVQNGAQVNAVASVANKTGAVTLNNSDVGLGNVANVAALPLAGGTLTGNLVSTSAGSSASPQLYLNGAYQNRIEFNTNGLGGPSIYSISTGTKIRLYPSFATSSATDFAIGLGNDGAGAPTRFWNSINNSSSRFEWFAGATSIATLSGGGQLALASNAGTVTPILTLVNNGNGSFRFFPQADGAGGYITFNSSANTTTNGILVGGTSTMTGLHGARRQGAFQWFAGTTDESSRFEFLTANGGTTAQTMTSRMAITAQGRVGIGTITPSGTLNVVGDAIVDNLKLDGNTLSATNTNGALIIAPNGAGALVGSSTGNARGTNAVDLQNSRSAATQVASGANSVIGGGANNTSSGISSTVAGGFNNTSSNSYSTVGGGQSNTSSGTYSTVGGGRSNTSSGYSSTVGGGQSNTSSGSYSTVGGGQNNTSSDSYSTVGGGRSNTSSGYSSTVGGGQSNTSSGSRSTVGGGQSNTSSGNRSTVGGGFSNTSSGSYSTVGGGSRNLAFSQGSFIGAGQNNVAAKKVRRANDITASTTTITVLGAVATDFDNTTANALQIRYRVGHYGAFAITPRTVNTATQIGANVTLVVTSNVGAVVPNQWTNVTVVNTAETDTSAGQVVGGGFNNISTNTNSTVGGGSNNTSSGTYSTVGGGLSNTSSGSYNTVGGGRSNTSSGNRSTVGGGQSNTSSSDYSTVGGGFSNTSSGSRSTVGGGSDNTSSGDYSTVGGGFSNTSSGSYSTVGGGFQNTSSDSYSTISGGANNIIDGVYSRYSCIPGGLHGLVKRYGELSHSAGGFNAVKGSAQHTILIARKLTTNTTATILTLNGANAGTDNRLAIATKTTWAFGIKLSAYNDNDNLAAGWNIRGCIRCNAANVTSIIGSNIVESWVEGAMSGCVATATADDTHKALQINVTGLASKNIRWVAVVDISQVSYGDLSFGE